MLPVVRSMALLWESRSPQGTSTEAVWCSARRVGLVLPVVSHHTAVLPRRRHHRNHTADRESLGSGRRGIIVGVSCNLSFRRDADYFSRHTAIWQEFSDDGAPAARSYGLPRT